MLMMKRRGEQVYEMKPLICAEVSASHCGSLDLARELVDAAAGAGADMVKFQTWQPDLMVAKPDRMIASGPWAGRTMGSLYDEAWTPWNWHAVLYRHASDIGLTPFSSVFDSPSLEFLETIACCPIYKIASFEILDVGLIQACAQTGKPLIISTGMANGVEIEDAVCAAEDGGCRDLTLLHCVSAYPAPITDMNLARMAALRQKYQCKVGLSDHSTGPIAAIAAAALGADMIERHICLDRAYGGPDAHFADDPAAFALAARAARAAAAAIGHASPLAPESEAPQRLLRRTLHYARALPAAHIMAEGDTYATRPGDGLPPKFASALRGRRLASVVCAGDAVAWRDVDPLPPPG